MRDTRKRLEGMFPDDPMVPSMVAACEENVFGFGVYLECHLWHRLWKHDAGKDKHLRAYLRNPMWPAKALSLCVKHGVPAPKWVHEWANDLANGRAKAPNDKNRDTAKSLEKTLEEISQALHTEFKFRNVYLLPDIAEADQATKLNPQDARRLRRVLLELNPNYNLPGITKRVLKAGKK